MSKEVVGAKASTATLLLEDPPPQTVSLGPREEPGQGYLGEGSVGTKRERRKRGQAPQKFGHASHLGEGSFLKKPAGSLRNLRNSAITGNNYETP